MGSYIISCSGTGASTRGAAPVRRAVALPHEGRGMSGVTGAGRVAR